MNSLIKDAGTVLKDFFGPSVIEEKSIGITSDFLSEIVLEILNSVKQNLICSVFRLSIYFLRK